MLALMFSLLRIVSFRSEPNLKVLRENSSTRMFIVELYAIGELFSSFFSSRLNVRIEFSRNNKILSVSIYLNINININLPKLSFVCQLFLIWSNQFSNDLGFSWPLSFTSCSLLVLVLLLSCLSSVFDELLSRINNVSRLNY